MSSDHSFLAINICVDVGFLIFLHKNVCVNNDLLLMTCYLGLQVYHIGEDTYYMAHQDVEKVVLCKCSNPGISMMLTPSMRRGLGRGQWQ